MKLELRAEEINVIRKMAVKKAKKLVTRLNNDVFIAYATEQIKMDLTKEVSFYECIAHKMESALMNFNNPQILE